MIRAALAALCLSLPAAAVAEGARVVSLDYCADQFVMGLLDDVQIAAVSPDADKDFSHLRARAAGLKQVRSLAEDVVALQPDIIVRSWGGDARAMQLFERLGIETVQIGYANDIDGAAEVTRSLAQALGVSDRGEALIAAMPAAVDSNGQRALYLTPGGVTAGRGTMVDSILRAAGLTNSVDAEGWTALPLESLVMRAPDTLVTAFFDFGTDRTDHWSVAQHPVIRRLREDAAAYPLDESRLTCPAWFVAGEARDLAERVARAQ